MNTDASSFGPSAAAADKLKTEYAKRVVIPRGTAQRAAHAKDQLLCDKYMRMLDSRLSANDSSDALYFLRALASLGSAVEASFVIVRFDQFKKAGKHIAIAALDCLGVIGGPSAIRFLQKIASESSEPNVPGAIGYEASRALVDAVNPGYEEFRGPRDATDEDILAIIQRTRNFNTRLVASFSVNGLSDYLYLIGKHDSMGSASIGKCVQSIVQSIPFSSLP